MDTSHIEFIITAAVTISTGVILLVLKRFFSNNDKTQVKIALLLEEQQELKAHNLAVILANKDLRELEWQKKTDATLELLRLRSHELANEIHERVTVENCKDVVQRFDERMRKLEHERRRDES